MADGLTTAQLAERTGVRPATLRMWEIRHGFPEPLDHGGGRRRYSLRQAEVVSEVLRLREQGLSLTAAIARARAEGAALPSPPPSIFAGLRERRPELAPTLLGKQALLALTRALEDEYCARATSGVLFASFQRVRFYRQSERRWRELARTAELAFALADFRSPAQPAHGPVEVPVARDHPLAREWTVVIDAPGAQACLAGWEQPESSELADRLRRFEVVWSFERDVVSVASTIASELVSAFAPGVADGVARDRARALSNTAAELRFAAALSHRIVGYLGAAVAPAG